MIFWMTRHSINICWIGVIDLAPILGLLDVICKISSGAKSKKIRDNLFTYFVVFSKVIKESFCPLLISFAAVTTKNSSKVPLFL